MEQLTIIKAYKDNAAVRHSFNQLTQDIFGFDFEDWYENGYWRDNYIPYSIWNGERIVANVSVNLMEFVWDGAEKRYIQLGTVMTDKSYRGRGLIRRLMMEINKDFEGKAEAVYLFANNSVLDFYPKFGFVRADQYQYVREVENQGEKTVHRVDMDNKAEWKKLESAIGSSVCDSRLTMKNNIGLFMFYVTKFMRQDVYYVEDSQSYVIAEEDKGELVIYNIFSETEADLDGIIRAFGREIKKVRLGFVPRNAKGYLTEKITEDTTLFIKGKGLEGFSQGEMMFPFLSHA